MLIEPKTLILSNGETLEIRSGRTSDAASVCRHRHMTSQETYFMARYPEECSLDAKKMSIQLQETADSPREFNVTALIGSKVIGDLGVTQVREHFKFRHRAYMGVSIQKAYWGMGIGTALLEIAVAQARCNGFQQLELGVFEDNIPAIRLYEKFGFQKYGVQPRAFQLKDGTYRDESIMVKFL